MSETPFADDKDWTWVLTELCTECEVDVREFPLTELPVMIRDNAREWGEILAGDDNVVRRRPRPDRWSALEYGAHVRDVFALYNYRLGLMLNEEGPHFPNWNQDETAREKNYGASDPKEVAAELTAAAESLARHLAIVTDDDWERPGFRSDGAEFTVESFARYLMHDPSHHLWDARRGIAALRGLEPADS